VRQILPNPVVQVRGVDRANSASYKFDAPGLIRLWHLISLDAPTVAVVWTLAFAWASKVRLPVWTPVLLALAAWVVYIVDRVLDARAAIRTNDLASLRERHRFHQRHMGLLIPVALVAAGAAGWIVFTLMPSVARERNSVLALAGLAYFARVHSPGKVAFGLTSFSRFLKKEMLVGILFAAACALPAISRASTHANQSLWPLYAAAVVFALLAWLNCHAIDRWESDEEECEKEWKATLDGTKDRVESRGFPPLRQKKGARTGHGWVSSIEDSESRWTADKSDVLLPAFLLAGGGLLLGAVLSFHQPRPAALIVAGAVSALLLALIDCLRSRLTPIAVRAAADLVLLVPLALLLK